MGNEGNIVSLGEGRSRLRAVEGEVCGAIELGLLRRSEAEIGSGGHGRGHGAAAVSGSVLRGRSVRGVRVVRHAVVACRGALRVRSRSSLAELFGCGAVQCGRGIAFLPTLRARSRRYANFPGPVWPDFGCSGFLGARALHLGCIAVKGVAFVADIFGGMHLRVGNFGTLFLGVRGIAWVPQENCILSEW